MRLSCMRDAYWDTISKPLAQAGAAAFFTSHMRGSPAAMHRASRQSTASMRANAAAGNRVAEADSGSPWARYTSTCSTSLRMMFARSPGLLIWKKPRGSFFRWRTMRRRMSVRHEYATRCALHVAAYMHTAFPATHATIAAET